METALGTPANTPAGKSDRLVPPEKAVGVGVRTSAIVSLLVWGRVVPDIPAFCRELIAALTER